MLWFLASLAQNLKKKLENFNLLFPKTEGSKCFPSSYGCYSTVSATQEQGKRSSKDKHLVYCSINRLDTPKKDDRICIKYTLCLISEFSRIFLAQASEILQILKVSFVNLRKSAYLANNQNHFGYGSFLGTKFID